MSKEWQSGAPPSLGWWPASYHRDPDCLRWWSGKYWSNPAHVGYSSLVAAKVAENPDDGSCMRPIEWRHRPESWPARSKT